ncbi:D-alanyl-D-alanine carboxypeptidase family protein [Promicromonospora sukumoe]|uniref:M15 family metallopeptidase n=1 Tax=Promicromonospora sukumoe TaxID=88382 RepID=UPI00364D0BB7
MPTETPLWPESRRSRRSARSRRPAPAARRHGRRRRRHPAVLLVLAVVLGVTASSGTAWALGMLDPGTVAAVPASVLSDVRERAAGHSTETVAQAAVADSTALAEELDTEVRSARALLRSGDDTAAGRAEREELRAAIEEAERVATALAAVTWSPSGTGEEAAALREQAAVLRDEARAAGAALRKATEAVAASGRERREGVQAAGGASAAPTDRTTGAATTDLGTGTGPDGVTASAGPAGTCPEPDQVWSADNGRLGPAQLAQLPFAPGHAVRSDVVSGLTDLNAAFAAEFGVNLTVSSSYRTYAEQEALYDPSSKTAAPPGCSNHGTGLAVDLGGGAETFGSPQYEWLRANGEAYGWVHPPFAEPSGRNPEPWHWQSVLAPNSY